MDDECPPEVIRMQMEETRSQLTEKLEALESQVKDTVQSTTAAVNETVETVKGTVASVSESVQETVHSVGEVLDLRIQAERHPWIVFGGSVAVGYLASTYLLSSGSPPALNTALAQAPTPPRDSWLKQQFRQLRGVAVGMMLDAVRDLAMKGFARPQVVPPEDRMPGSASAPQAAESESVTMPTTYRYRPSVAGIPTA